MPLFGLAKATSHVPIGPGTNTAKQRMGRAAPRNITGSDRVGAGS